MQKWAVLLLVVQILLALHGDAFRLPWDSPDDFKEEKHENEPTKGKVNAVIVILIRNSEIGGLEQSLHSFEETFNRRYHYPYVFLNDEEFTDEFKSRARRLSQSNMTFGLIPREHWSYPDWIDQGKAARGRMDLQQRNIPYGGSESYRHMCRFNSGFFYKHPLLQQYDYHWRVEPGVTFSCTLQYDPFELMKHRNYYYGFNVILYDSPETVVSLWDATKQFIKAHPKMIPKENALQLITDGKDEYNTCHYWSNFEIANLNFFRSKQYNAYFDHLDQYGGFFYERWGDAPVHSVALSMLLPIDKIHYFEDIGYYHPPYGNCPANEQMLKHCRCNPRDSLSVTSECMPRFRALKHKENVGNLMERSKITS